jgi:hypothetical protein
MRLRYRPSNNSDREPSLLEKLLRGALGLVLIFLFVLLAVGAPIATVAHLYAGNYIAGFAHAALSLLPIAVWKLNEL